MSHRPDFIYDPSPWRTIPGEHREEIAQMLKPLNRSAKSLEAQEVLLGEMMATLTMERNKTSLRSDPALIEKLFEIIDGWERRYTKIKEESKPMTELNNDASMTPEIARALHRVVRAMHDGNCPKCGHLGSSEEFYRKERFPSPDRGFHQCPECGFCILDRDSTAALAAFHPYMEANVAVFEQWRTARKQHLNAKQSP